MLINDFIMKMSVREGLMVHFKAAVLLMNVMINITRANYLSDIDLCVKTQCAVLIKAPQKPSSIHLTWFWLFRMVFKVKMRVLNYYYLMRNCRSVAND